ncbi:MAG: transposase, partial [Gammaproteobacteria bacterium]|nr:transposase [Gammaproteobacteria bacterium]
MLVQREMDSDIMRSPEEKLAIVRHQLEKVSVSDICDTESIAPSVFYRWQQELFDHGAGSFEQGSHRKK